MGLEFRICKNASVNREQVSIALGLRGVKVIDKDMGYGIRE